MICMVNDKPFMAILTVGYLSLSPHIESPLDPRGQVACINLAKSQIATNTSYVLETCEGGARRRAGVKIFGVLVW